MNPALLFLMVRSVRGRIVRTLRLLKQPKYLIGVAVFVLWIVGWVGGPLFLDGDPGDVNVQFVNAELMFELMGDAVPALQLLVALAMALFFSLWWLLPWSRMAMNLTEAEIHMLTPMPVKRRHLIQYATLKSQPGILFGCTIMTVFLGSGGPASRLLWFAAFWGFLTLWDLHSKGRALWLERQKELPRERAWRNRVLLTAAIAGYWIVIVTILSGLVAELATLRPAPEQEVFDFVRQTLATYGPRLQAGLLGWLLLPFRWASAPLFILAPGVETLMRVTGVIMPLLLLVTHNEWVVRSQAKFEEAALAHAQRESSKKRPGARYWKTSLRSRRRMSFPLAPVGAPELGILWKNSMIVTRFSYRTLVLLGLVPIGLAVLISFAFLSLRGVPFVFMWLGFMTMVLSPITGSQSFRNDLRADLLRVEMVRPWPIEGWRLFAAECAAPSIYGAMTVMLGAMMVVAMDVFLTLNHGFSGVENDLRILPDSVVESLAAPRALLVPLMILGAIPLFLALTALSTSLQNLLVLLFPGWVQLGSEKTQGAAAFGQNMIMFLGLGLASLLCLLPAGLVIALIIAVQRWIFGVPLLAWEFPIFGIIAATPVMAVVALIVRTGGRIWDKLDPSSEILAGPA